MTDGIHVIESDDYREEIKTLKKDPIIIGMVREILEAHHEMNVMSGEFMGLTLTEYSKRCEKTGQKNQAFSIGGPIRAIRELLRESGDERYDKRA